MLKSKILVIEEDRSLVEVLENNLTNSGYEVFCAYDGQSGLNQARSINPDLIILDASYCNFLITNQCVLVPQFGVAASDAQALGILSPLFPDRRLVPLPSKELAVGLGSFHCLSQQQPA